jgi:hypothetical protein
MGRTTDRFFELIESSFNVDEITPEKIIDKFYSGSFGKTKNGKDKSGKQRYGKSKATSGGYEKFMGIAQTLSEGRDIVESIEKVTEYDELRALHKRAKGLTIYSKEVSKRIESKQESLSKELSKLTEERKQKREINKKISSIERDLDNFENMRDLKKIEKKISILPVKVTELELRVLELKKSLEEQIINERTLRRIERFQEILETSDDKRLLRRAKRNLEKKRYKELM